MENFSIKILLIFGIFAGALFSSCSRQITSSASMNKMISRETLVSNKVQPKDDIAPCLPEVNIMPQQVAENNTSSSIKNKDKASASPGKKHHLSFLTTNFAKEVITDVKTQTAAITTFGLKKKTIASYTGNQHTQGFLGIAGICLIVAIVLVILGFTTAKWLFDLAVILFVAAVVFFLLYLVAKAASPKAP